MPKQTVHDLKNLSGKRVLVRVDFNVPQDATGKITNDRRIRAGLPTIKFILDAGGAVILMSHLGRPSGDPAKDALLKLDKVAARLSQLLGRPVKKASDSFSRPSAWYAMAFIDARMGSIGTRSISGKAFWGRPCIT